jgi:hypothetical protein
MGTNDAHKIEGKPQVTITSMVFVSGAFLSVFFVYFAVTPLDAVGS